MICCYSGVLGSRIIGLLSLIWPQEKILLLFYSCELGSIVDYVSVNLKLVCGWCGFLLLLTALC